MSRIPKPRPASTSAHKKGSPLNLGKINNHSTTQPGKINNHSTTQPVENQQPLNHSATQPGKTNNHDFLEIFFVILKIDSNQSQVVSWNSPDVQQTKRKPVIIDYLTFNQFKSLTFT